MESIVSWILPTLKMVSIVLTGILGVVALLVDFRDEKGKVTRWGRWSLIGVIVGTLVSAAMTGFEMVREEAQSQQTAQESLELSQKTSKIMQDINRSLNPLKDVQFSFSVDVSLKDAAFAGYKERLEQRVQKLLGKYGSKLKVPKNELVVATADSDGAITLDVNGRSPLFPSEEEETAAYYALRQIDLVLEFYRRPIQPDAYCGGIDEVEQYVHPDLAIEVTTSGLDDRDASIQYDVRTGECQVRVPWIKSDAKYWRSNGSIIAIPDLVGAQMFVFVRSAVVPADVESIQELVKARAGLRLQNLTMKVGDGRELSFNRSQMKELATPDGLKYYVFEFEQMGQP